MITFIEGIIEEKKPTYIVVNANGVGYEINITLNTYEDLPSTGDKYKVHTVHNVREDNEQLFGFSQKSEKNFFIKLISVSGIGPALAIAILSGMPITTICSSIAANDSKRLSTIKGVGKKTAERMIVELRDKIDQFQAVEGLGANPDNQLLNDATMALVALGFRNSDALSAVKKTINATDSNATVQDVVRLSLSNLQK